MATASDTWIVQPWQMPKAVERVKAQLGRFALEMRFGAASKPPIPAKNTLRDGKVLILPGMMGSCLSVIKDGQPEMAWLRPADIAKGGIARLKWPAAVTATGALAVSYSQMLMRLRLAGYDTDFLPFDWRQTPNVTGDQLISQLRAQGQHGVTLVCHSMGGLVARQMAAADPHGNVISKVITIGTPNSGSYAPLQMFDLSHPTLALLARIDAVHDRRTLVQRYLRDFPGLLAMLPTMCGGRTEDHFNMASWPTDSIKPRAALLERARASVAALPAPDARFHQIIGIGQSTIVAARSGAVGFQYDRSYDGDGVVSRDLAEMSDVPRYYVRCAHGRLCNNDTVISATIDLICRNRTTAIISKSGWRRSNEVARAS